MATWNEAEKKKIAGLIASAKITRDTAWYKKSVIPKIIKNKALYREISIECGVPLALVPLIHCQEMGSDLGVFKAYLGNGQPFNKKTTIVPKGRGPFESWKAGAIDAIRLDGLDTVKEWTLERMLFELEGFNGFGYRKHGINSPYVWCFTNHYSKGRYVRDRVFDANAESKNIGCFALYKMLCEADSDFILGGDETPKVEVSDELETPSWFDSFKKWIMLLIEKVFGIKTPPVAEDIEPEEPKKSKAPWFWEVKKFEGKKETDPKFQAHMNQYWKATGLPSFKGLVGSARAWCGIFAAMGLIVVGLNVPKDAFRAISWDKNGQAINWRVNGFPQGAFVRINGSGNCESAADNHITMSNGDCAAADLLKSGATFSGFGGNQGNQAKVSSYPVKNICSVTWPSGEALPGKIIKSVNCSNGKTADNESTR